MDKKLLVSLMMTAPVAVFAQSNWTAGGNGYLSYSILPEGNTANWSPDALVDLTVKDNALVCPVSVKYLQHNAVLPVGKWAWNCESLDNAIIYINNVAQVQRNAQGQPVDANGKKTDKVAEWVALTSFEVNYSAETTVNIRIMRKSSDLEFSVGKLTMSLDFNFSEVKTALQSALDAITLKNVNESDDRQAAKNLRVRKGQLETEASGIQGDINKIKLESGQDLWSAYTNYSLNKWNSDSKKASDAITVKINSYKGSVNAYNGEVDAENAIWKNIQENTTALNTLNNDVIALQSQLNNKKTEIDDVLVNNPQAGELGAYCKNATASEIEAAQTAIDNYKAAIEAAYKDLTKPVNNFENKTKAIEDQIAAISYNEAINRWNNYDEFLKALGKVEDTYGRMFALINNVYTKYDIKNSTVYDDVIGADCVELAKIYNNNTGYVINQLGGLTAGNTNIDAATDANLDAAKTDMEERVEAMEGIYDSLCDLIVDQEAQLKKANDKIKELQEAYEAKLALTENEGFSKLKPADQTMLKNDLIAWNNAIDALKTEKDKEYKAHTLDVEDNTDFTSKVTAVDDAEQKFNDDASSKNLTAVLQLISDLEGAKKYVNKNAKNVGGYDLTGKFTETFANIQSAIDQYYSDPSATAEADIKSAIGTEADKTGVYASCNTLVDAFKVTLNQIEKANSELVKFKNAISNKTVVVKGIPSPAYDKASYKYESGDISFSYATAETALLKYKSDLSEIANGKEKYGNPYEAYQGAQTVKADIEEDNYAYYLPFAVTDFENKVSEKNLEALTGLVDDITTTVKTGKYVGVPGMPKEGDLALSFDKNYKGFKDDADAIEAVNAALGNAQELAACDTKIQLLIDAYQGLYTKIEEAKANKDAYDALLVKFGELQTALTTFKNAIATITVAPATVWFEQKATVLQGDLNKENLEIVNAYNAEELKVASNKETHLTHIINLNTKVKDLDKDCRDNQKYYDDQVRAAKNLANEANTLIDLLKSIDKVQDNLNKYLEDINKVQEELANINVDLTSSFAKGESVTKDETYQNDFNRLSEKLKSIQAEEDQGYKAAVIESNNAYLKGQGADINQLNADYNDAVTTVNHYRYDISNVGYLLALEQNETYVKNHQLIQDCYKRIATLQSQLSSFTEALTQGQRSEYTVLTDNNVTKGGYKLQDLVNEANSIARDIQNALNAVNTAATNVAKAYYNGEGENPGLLATAQGYYSEVATRLTKAITGNDLVPGAELPEDVAKVIENESTKLSSAIKTYSELYSKVNEATGANESAFILGMNGICTNLDAVIDAMHDPDSFVYDKIRGLWNSAYAEAYTTLSDYLTEVRTYVDADDAEANAEDISNKISEASYLNSTFLYSLTDADRELEYADYSERLQNLLDAAETVVENAKNQHEAAQKNSTAKKILLTNEDSYLNNTLKDLNTLLEWSGYHRDQLDVVDGLQTQIDALEAEVKADKNLNVNQRSYENRFTILRTDIRNSYSTVFTQEIGFANTLMVKARSAFNNVKLLLGESISSEELNKYDSDIKGLRGQIDALVVAGFNYNDRVSLMDKLRAVGGIEDQLAAIINQLEEMGKVGNVTTDTYVKALEDLDNQYNTLNTDLTQLASNVQAARTNYGSYGEEVASEYEPKVSDLEAELAEVFGNYRNAGVDVIADADKYSYAMTQITEKYIECKKSWDLAVPLAQQKYNSDVAYDKLVGELNDLEQQAMIVNTQAVRYNVTVTQWKTLYEDVMTRINGRAADPETGIGAVRGERAELKSKKDRYELGTFSYIPYTIVNEVFEYVHNVLEYIAYEVKSEVEGEIENDIFNVDNPGIINGQQVYYVDPSGLRAQLREQLKEARSVDVASIIERIINEDYSVATTNEEAINNYESVMDQLNDIRAAVLEILAEADENNRYIKGDLTNDTRISIADAQMMINLILEGTTYNDLVKDGDKRLAYAADIIDNSKIDIADYTALINIILKKDNNGPKKVSRLSFFNTRGSMQSEGWINIVPVAEDNGIRTYAVEISDPEAFVAGQIDFMVESTSRIVDVRGAERLGGHDVQISELGNSTRVVISSEENVEFAGNQGVTLYVDVDGHSGLGFHNAIFADANAQAYTFSDKATDTTGVDSLIEGAKAVKEAVYDAAGRVKKSISRGINIIRNSNGTVTKEIRK